MIKFYPRLFSSLILLLLLGINSYSIQVLKETNDTLNTTEHTDNEDLLWDSASIAGFFDQFFMEEMEKRHVPGAIFSLVKNGELIYLKGYGYSNMDTREPVDPFQTTFFAGSVSKLFTATAIMQLHERGEVDLNTDVQEYMDELIIDDNFRDPVTLGHLLSHTGGFEERTLNLATADSTYKVSIYEYLNSGLQPRVLPPGKYISYSNFGMTLAGYIVQEVSGMSFSDYIAGNILLPLEMANSSFDYPDDLMARLATAYNYTSGKFNPLPAPWLFCVPAGALITTASDMANFMIAHLQQGIFKDTSILRVETARQMHSRLFTHHPQLEGMCHGFYENFENNLRIIQHAGDINGFGSLLVLIPEKNVGFFVSISGGDAMGRKFRDNLEQNFIDHFYPSDPPVIAPSPGSGREAGLSRFAGTYRMNRYSRLSFEKLTGLIFEASIKVNEDDTLSLLPPFIFRGEPAKWVRIGPLLFRNPENGKYMSFIENERGRITHMNTFLGIPGNFEKIPWYGSGKFNLPLLLIILLLHLSVVPGWQLVALVRRILRRKKRRTLIEKRCIQTGVIVVSLNLFFLIGQAICIAIAGNDIMGKGLPVYVKVFYVIPFLSALVTLLLIWFNLQVWRYKCWSLISRLYYTLVVCTTVLFIWFLSFWNMLGFNF